MKQRNFAAPTDSLLLWLACGVVACAGFTLDFGLLGSAIETQQSRIGAIATIRLENARILAQRPQLERAQSALDERLRKVALRADRATTVAAFIRVASRITAAHRIGILQIDERSDGAAAPAPRRTRDAASPFEPIPLDVALSGSYDDLLAAIRDLGAAGVTMRIEIASLERAPHSATGIGDALTARLRVELEHLPSPPQSPTAPATVLEEPLNHARPD